MNDKRLRLEAMIASPPTAACEAIVAMLDDIVAAHPDQVVLDVYLAGEQPGCEPTKGYQDKGKYKRVPNVFVNGIMVAQVEAPGPAVLASIVEAELQKGPAGWQD